MRPSDSAWPRSERASSGRRPNARAWLAERSGEIAAIAASARASERTVALEDLYVGPTAWGTGVANGLLEAALESVGGNAEEAFLWVGEQNARARRSTSARTGRPNGASRASPLGPSEVRYRRPLAFSKRP